MIYDPAEGYVLDMASFEEFNARVTTSWAGATTCAINEDGTIEGHLHHQVRRTRTTHAPVHPYGADEADTLLRHLLRL